MLMIIKLGGGLIAPKDRLAETADREIIKKLAGQLKEFWDNGNKLIVVNGSGNFAHTWATKYETQKGFDLEDKEKKWGAARTQHSASLINKIVVEELLEAGLPAGSVAPHDLETYKLVGQMVEMGLIPVLYGDVIWDAQKGSVIYSGETVIGKIVEEVKVDLVVQVGRELGVWDENKKIISEINEKNWERYKTAIQGSFGVDVTGGMLHKVETSLQIAKKLGIKTFITNNLEDFESGTKVW